MAYLNTHTETFMIPDQKQDNENNPRMKRYQVLLDPGEAALIDAIVASEGRKVSNVLRIFIEIGIYTLLDNQAEVNKRLRRVQVLNKEDIEKLLLVN